VEEITTKPWKNEATKARKRKREEESFEKPLRFFLFD
jgi:hypothetical protein